MELWHHTEDAPRSPEAVAAGQPVALWIGSWPVEMGQYVTVSWKAIHATGVIETGSIQAQWQYAEPRNDNSYWLATLGPFLEADEVESRIHGESKDGKVSTSAYTFRSRQQPERKHTEGSPYARAHEIIFAGFGGQGVLSMGHIVAYAAMVEGKEVSWMPSYGPEMRGGTANCVVIVSPGRISSPIVTRFDSAIVLNQPSLEKFESKVKPGGFLLYEKSTIITVPTRHDIEILVVPAIEEAVNLQKKQVANMILLGAFLVPECLLAVNTTSEPGRNRLWIGLCTFLLIRKL